MESTDIQALTDAVLEVYRILWWVALWLFLGAGGTTIIHKCK